jgi:hypothetical protein
MLTHDELIYCLQQRFPNATHGKDFWVGQAVDKETGAQTEDARVYAWNLPEPLPTDEELQELVRKHRDGARAFLAERDARIERERRLKVADTLVYKAMDMGDMERMRVAGQYRQALRDVTSLPGFPLNFAWPEVPTDLQGWLPAGA